MAPQTLSGNDNAVLSQIFDPESAPTAGVLIDSSLPEDPHIADPIQWSNLKQTERTIILRVEASLKDKDSQSKLHEAAKDMQQLISIYPNCACLLNDQAQILRLIHGNDLVSGAYPDLTSKAHQILTKAITLLTPSTPQAAISPSQAQTLAQAHTQRGALLHGLAKNISSPDTRLSMPLLKGLTKTDLQEAASRDFFMGGRYGNEIGKALAVRINPTAKLCGQMVKNAMRKEYAEMS